MEKATSDSKTETSKVNSKLDDHVKVYNLCMSDINLELLNLLAKNMIFNKNNHTPKEILIQWVNSIIKDKASNRPIWEFKKEVKLLEEICRLKFENSDTFDFKNNNCKYF